MTLIKSMTGYGRAVETVNEELMIAQDTAELVKG